MDRARVGRAALADLLVRAHAGRCIRRVPLQVGLRVRVDAPGSARHALAWVDVRDSVGRVRKQGPAG